MSRIPSTVLVADDDADSRTILRDLLEHHGRTVFEAADGIACLRVAALRLPDLIVLDLVMPGLDGWRTAGALKADPITRSIPILALSAAALPEHQDRARAAGCDRVLTKPIDPCRLAVEIDALYEQVCLEAMP